MANDSEAISLVNLPDDSEEYVQLWQHCFTVVFWNVRFAKTLNSTATITMLHITAFNDQSFSLALHVSSHTKATSPHDLEVFAQLHGKYC